MGHCRATCTYLFVGVDCVDLPSMTVSSVKHRVSPVPS